MNDNTTPSARRLDYHYIAMQAGFWAMFAGVCAYQTALLLDRGFSNSQIGLITAIRCLAGIVSQPLLGGFADRHPEVPLKVLVSGSLGVSLLAGLYYALRPGMSLWETGAVFLVVGGLEVSAYPLMDAMAIQFINGGVPIRYSLGRGVGSMSYAVVCVLLGWIVGRWGVEYTLTVHAVLVVLEIVLVLTFPACRTGTADAAQGEKPHSALALLKGDPAFTLTLAGVLLGMTGVLPFSNFLVNVVVSRGGSEADLGIALFLMAGFELPTGFVFQRLLRRYGSARLLLVSLVFCALKGAALLAAPSYGAVLLAQPLQMLGYGLFTPASVYYVNESVPPADRVRGQTLMMAASNGLGGMLGSFLAGRTLDAGGADLMLACCTACCCAGALLCLAALRKKSKSHN